jgi:hypothetical protein
MEFQVLIVFLLLLTGVDVHLASANLVDLLFNGCFVRLERRGRRRL